MLTEKIYYFNDEIKQSLLSDFKLVDETAWYFLYRSNTDKSYWRLDKPDKYQTQYFIKLNDFENWAEVDAKKLQIGLLLKQRGKNDNETCIWKNCKSNKLNGLAYCEKHAYEEMGIKY